MSELPALGLRLCCACGGQPELRAGCRHCGGAGMFDGGGRPFIAPPPFDGWEPARLVALERASRQRSAPPVSRYTPATDWRNALARQRNLTAAPPPERPHRLSLSEIVQLLLTKSPADHSTIRLSRNAKGDTQVDVSIRTGEAGLETVEDARAKAEETYDHLCELYPMRSGG